jgi:hypothetical protein
MSLEMAHKVILPPKKNYIPQFLKQRDINSYFVNPSIFVGKFYISAFFNLCFLATQFKINKISLLTGLEMQRGRYIAH